jgi:hypothetical protein
LYLEKWMSGTIVTSSTQTGIYLGAGGYNPVTIATGVTISNVNDPAIGSGYATYWTIVNYGTLLATGAGYADGVLLFAGGGSVTNAAGGVMYGYNVGVSVAGSGTVVNQGTIRNANSSGLGFYVGSAAVTATGGGVILGGGGVYNGPNGLISSPMEGVAVGNGGSVLNAGMIIGSGPTTGLGVLLTAGGSVTNAQTGTINATQDGILAFDAPATVNNQGFIGAQYNFGVDLVAGGLLTNASTGQIKAYFDGLHAEGSIASTVINAGLLYGKYGSGAYLNAGGSVTNSGTGQINGYYFGVRIGGGAGSVTNAATIITYATLSARNHTTFSSAGVQLADGGVVTNAVGGIIASHWMGVQIGDSTTSDVSGSVVNYGVILAEDALGDGAGVWIHGPGVITNEKGGVISGGGYGIVAYYQTTLVNQGTVFATSQAFDAARPGYADRVIDQPGGAFSGLVNGGNTLGSSIYSTLELASGTSTGTIVNIGTFVDFGRIALDAGATWSVGGAFVAGETIGFGGPDASLILASPSAAAATISGFTTTNTIVLEGITDVSGLHFGAGNLLTVSESTAPGLTLQFDAQPDLQYAVVDGSTDIYVPCFLPGTFILTDQGEVPVEKLQLGDRIATLSGTTRRLSWIGRGRTLATRGRRNAATPVIVQKGALADNVPHHDLHITKGHALFLDGVLIPAEFLVNHRSILWDDRAQEVTVFHLELDTHDVLIANGAAAESYRDDGNRWLFQNANDGWDQPPKPPCAPVLTGGPVVDAVWRRLLDRAGPRPGLPLTDNADLHLLVDDERVDAAAEYGAAHVFRLHRTPNRVQIASRDVVPAEVGLARDARPLGIAVRRIAVRQGSRFVVLRANDPRLAEGFHPYEADGHLRWTNGTATLPAAAFAPFQGAMEVVLHVAATTYYPCPNDPARAAARAA